VNDHHTVVEDKIYIKVRPHPRGTRFTDGLGWNLAASRHTPLILTSPLIRTSQDLDGMNKLTRITAAAVLGKFKQRPESGPGAWDE